MLGHELDDLIVVKRSGQRVEFNGPKIAIAIKKGFDDIIGKYTEKDINKVYEDTLKHIIDNYQERKTINVEDIQDIIESTLKKDKYLDVYQKFSEYRIRRSESRKAFSIKQQHKFVKAIEKIGTINVNKLHPDKLLYKFGSTISSEYTKSYVLDNKYIRAHEEGKIYIHELAYFNLGYLSHTHLILNKVLESDNCFYELLNSLISVKSEINGEVAIDNIDNLLSNYILNKYKLNFKEILYCYLNVTGFLPFVNIKRFEEQLSRETTINIKLDDYNTLFVNDQLKTILKYAYRDTLTNINNFLSTNINKLLTTLNNNYANNSKYCLSLGTSTSEEGKLVKKIVIEEINKLSYLENVALIYKIKKDVLDITLEELALLILTNKNIKINYIESSEVEYFSSGFRIFESINSEAQSTGRSNIANTSINMGRLGLKYRQLNNEFYKELDETLELVRNELLFVFETIGDKNKDNYQVLFNGNILDDEKLEPGQKIRKVIKNGTLNINLIGLKECAIAIDKNNYTEIILKIIKYINEKTSTYSQETKLNFTLSVVEEEYVNHKLINLDKAIFGLVDGITKKDKYEEFSVAFNNNNENELLINIGKYQKLLTGGNILRIIIPKNSSTKKITSIIKQIIEAKVVFASIEIGRGRE